MGKLKSCGNWVVTKLRGLVPESVENLALRVSNGRERRRVVVIGSRNSGKTVLLTAIARHLIEDVPSQVRSPKQGSSNSSWLDFGQWSVVYKKPLRAFTDRELGGFPPFDYKNAIQQIAQGEWPQKTYDTRVLALDLDLNKGRKKRKVRLEILDLPGEQVADFSMLGKSFREWSQWIREDVAWCGRYLEAIAKDIEKTRVEKERILNLFKEYYVEQYCKGVPMLIPAMPKVNAFKKMMKMFEGRMPPKEKRIEEFEEAISLSFAPIPDECFKKESRLYSLANEFSNAYDEYVKTNIEPIEKWMSKAGHLFYLVDVISILKGGQKFLDDEKKFGEESLRGLIPSSSRNFMKWFWAGSGIRNAYIVATKADCVANEQDRKNMSELTKEMFGNVLSDVTDSKAGEANFLTCAAVRTTQKEGEGNDLKGRHYKTIEKTAANVKTVTKEIVNEEYSVPSISDKWPDNNEDWKKKIMDYKKILETFPSELGSNTVPEQIALSDIVKIKLGV